MAATLTAAEFNFVQPPPTSRRRRPSGMYASWVARQTGTFTAQDLADALGVGRQRAASQLTKLMYDGKVVKVSGVWRGYAVWRAVK